MTEWLHTVQRSYWQRGCDDAKAGRPYYPPTLESEWQGYRKGYDFGRALNPPNKPLPRDIGAKPTEPKNGTPATEPRRMFWRFGEGGTAGAGEAIGINGLTEAETNATASVMGIVEAAPTASTQSGCPTFADEWRQPRTADDSRS